MLCITEEPLDAAALLKEFEAKAPHAGGIVTFSGRVRPDAANAAVKSLLLQSYAPMTKNGIRAAMDTALTRWPLDACTVVHREGEMAPGETIVFVAAASKHRRAAFEAADFLMDYLKTKNRTSIWRILIITLYTIYDFRLIVLIQMLVNLMIVLF